MFVIVKNDYDETTVEFVTNAGPALEVFNQHKENFDSNNDLGVALFEVTGDGRITIGHDLSADENARIIDSFDVNDLEDENEDDE